MMLVNQVLDIDLRHRQLVPIDQPQLALPALFRFACPRHWLFWQLQQFFLFGHSLLWRIHVDPRYGHSFFHGF